MGFTVEPLVHTVFYTSKGWMVRLRTTEVGPYMSQDFALRIAVAEGRHLKEAGTSVLIVVRDKIGKIVAKYPL